MSGAVRTGAALSGEAVQGRSRFDIVAITIASIITPVVIGAIVQATGSFDGTLVFVGADALVAILSYLVVRDINRVMLRAAAA